MASLFILAWHGFPFLLLTENLLLTSGMALETARLLFFFTASRMWVLKKFKPNVPSVLDQTPCSGLLVCPATVVEGSSGHLSPLSSAVVTQGSKKDINGRSYSLSALLGEEDDCSAYVSSLNSPPQSRTEGQPHPVMGVHSLAPSFLSLAHLPVTPSREAWACDFTLQTRAHNYTKETLILAFLIRKRMFWKEDREGQKCSLGNLVQKTDMHPGRQNPAKMPLLFIRSVVSNSLQPHGVQHTRHPHPPLSPRICLSSCPLSQWCHPTNSSSVVLFSSCP